MTHAQILKEIRTNPDRVIRTPLEYYAFLEGIHSLAVVGPRGTGKSSLGTAMAVNCMRDPIAGIDLARCKAEIAKLRKGGWNVSLPDDVKHLVYVADDSITDGDRISMSLDFNKLGLPDGTNDVAYLLYGGRVFIMEIQGKADCRKWNDKDGAPSDGLYRELELQRKFGMKWVYDAQDLFSVDKRIRIHTDCVARVMGMDVICHSRDVKHQKPLLCSWYTLCFESAEVYGNFLQTGDITDAQKVIFRFKGNIFQHYDTFAGRAHFLNGIEDKGFDCAPAKPSGYNKKDMQEYCQKFPISKPKASKGGDA